MSEAPPLEIADRPVRVLVGDAIAPTLRHDIAHAQQPRVDVLEMETRLGGQVHDFSTLSSASRPGPRFLGACARRTGLWSEFTALHATATAPSDTVVYATGEDVGIIAALALRAMRRRDVRLVMRLEHMDYGRSPARARIHRALMAAALDRVDVVLCRTRRHVDRLQREYGLDASKVRFVPQPVDAHFFDPRRETRDGDTVASGRPYVVSAGLEMRDYGTLVEAARGLPVDVVIGAGSPWSKDTYEAGADLPANVTVASFSPVEMRRLYRGARAVVVPIHPTSRACGMNVVLEAWAMGLPVVVSRTEGLVSYVTDGHNGVFAEPGDPDDLRTKLEMVLVDDELAEHIGREGRRCTLESFTLDHYLDAVVSEMVAGPR